ncbi:MAG: hypothetical protein K2X27_11680 [Candidatus Obscuribacterales bacterium]|nr:hypothetical protein [Candidatus Obscuribacterales bacterium]
MSIKFMLFQVFKNNPGEALEFWLAFNLRWLCRSYSLPWAITWLAIAVPLLSGWSKLPPFLKGCAWILPIHTMILLFVGRIEEMRVYYELLPIILVLSLPGLAKLMDLKLTPLHTEKSPRLQ